MDETPNLDSDLEEEFNFLHLANDRLKPDYLDERILISKLWKLSLFYLYGGSETQREWLTNALATVDSYLVTSKEEPDLSTHVRELEDDKYIEEDEFVKRSEALYTTIMNEESSIANLQVIMKDLVAIAVQKGTYDARYRTTIRTMASATHTDWETIDEIEKSLVERLATIKAEEEERAKKRKSEQDKKNMKRAFLIGLTAVSGGAILALSAGLAAPLIGAGAVAVLGSSSAAIFTGTSGVAIIASIFGAAGAGLTGFKMTKRIGKIEQFEFSSLSNIPHLHMTLAVSGFCSTEDDSGFSTPWEALDNSTEQYSLVWEGKYLRRLGSSIIDFVKREAMQAAVKEILRYTALRAVLKSIAWPLTLISAANIIDNPWNVCTQRSKEAGNQLAYVLLNRHQGYRPVTLIGFSLGARVIFYCLQKMLTEKDYQGIVEDVILMGAPVGVVQSEWEALEAVVSGTLYNCYSRSDWLLKFVYRAASIQVGDIAGLGPIELSWPRVRNVDLGEIIKSHSDYSEPTVISEILDLIGVKTKPVEPPSPKTSLNNPQEIVKQISKTPKELLSQTPIFNNKDNSSQSELTPQEQETVERLAACQNSNIVENFPKWRARDSVDSNTELQLYNSNEKLSPFRRVISLPKRFGLTGKAAGKGEIINSTTEYEEVATTGTPEAYSDNDLQDCAIDDDADSGITMHTLCQPRDENLAVHHGILRRHSTDGNVLEKIKTSDDDEEDKPDPSSSKEKNNKYKELFNTSKQAAISIFSKTSSPKSSVASAGDAPYSNQNEAIDRRRGSEGMPVGTNELKSGNDNRRIMRKLSVLENRTTNFFGRLRKNIDSAQPCSFAKLSHTDNAKESKEIGVVNDKDGSLNSDSLGDSIQRGSRKTAKKHSAP